MAEFLDAKTTLQLALEPRKEAGVRIMVGSSLDTWILVGKWLDHGWLRNATESWGPNIRQQALDDFEELFEVCRQRTPHNSID